MNQNIVQAINAKNLISFMYKDMLRIVEPHAYGETKNGDEKLRAYQVGGQSETRTIPCWGLYRVEEIYNLKILPDLFASPENDYNKGDKALFIIYAEL